jgi:hypothetical protein
MGSDGAGAFDLTDTADVGFDAVEAFNPARVPKGRAVARFDARGARDHDDLP